MSKQASNCAPNRVLNSKTRRVPQSVHVNTIVDVETMGSPRERATLRITSHVTDIKRDERKKKPNSGTTRPKRAPYSNRPRWSTRLNCRSSSEVNRLSFKGCLGFTANVTYTTSAVAEKPRFNFLIKLLGIVYCSSHSTQIQIKNQIKSPTKGSKTASLLLSTFAQKTDTHIGT